MPSLSKTIPIDDSRKVVLSITIGEAQVGTSLVTVTGKESGDARHDSFTLDLGAGLAGKRINCSTLVVDVRRETNRTSVTYTVTNGDDVHEFTKEGAAATDGDIVGYLARFTLRAKV